MDKPGTYVIQLIVNDGRVNSPVAQVVITTENAPPVANAGPDQSILVTEQVFLDGSASSDVNHDPLTFTWSFASKPEGSIAVLSDPNAAKPTFTVDKPGSYVMQLIVKDGTVDSLPDTVVITTQNSKPLADAGTDQTVFVNQTVTLDGRNSKDVDGGALTFAWSFASKPEGSVVTLSGSAAQQPTFTVDKFGTYVVQLIVNDGTVDSTPVTVTISTLNSKPLANAGPDQQNVQVNTLVYLDGRASSDADEDLWTYAWSFTTKPPTSAAVLLDATKAEPTFIADIAGTYVVELIVYDSKEYSAPDTVTITVEPPVPVNQPPTFTSTPVTQTLAGAAYSYPVTATDANNDPLTYALVNNPPQGMAINATGLITWTPSLTQTGAFPVTVTVTDNKSAPVEQAFTLTVQAATVTVPNVAGLSQSAAEAAIISAGLTVGSVTQEASATVAAGNVISQNPAANDSVSQGSAVALVVSSGSGGGQLPPDPSTIAPKIDPTVATTTYAATQFLYTGANPVQTGVTPGTIEARRAAVIRGRVLTRDNQPLSGVTISLLNHPEFGQTLSRADGQFDMAVNGGGVLTVNYAKGGFLTAQRQVDAPWQDYALAADVVLIPVDAQVTTINLNSNAPMQTAQSKVQTDSDGIRRATLLFPQGTQAHMVMPDGSTPPITTLSVRATEFTVGPNGPATMPAELPPNSGYTYAVVFTADEAKAAGAKDVVFDHPIPFYVENFLNMPIGTSVPLGAYSYDRGVWVASDSGKVIKILNIAASLANLDTDGDNVIDNGVALGVSDAERQQLASLYPAGQSLWRMAIPHFDQPWDANMGTRCKNNKCDSPKPPKPTPKTPLVPKSCKVPGSVIECENQVLGESVGITGTSFSLQYQSDRTPGFKSGGLNIPLVGATMPEGLKQITMEVTVAGKKFTQSFAPQANSVASYEWDGKDAYGRPVLGNQKATVRIGYAYELEYVPTTRFGYNGDGTISTAPARQEINLWSTRQTRVERWYPTSAGLGGWSLDAHHVYDPMEQVLYLGTGERRDAQAQLVDVVSTVAGGSSGSFSGDGGPATQAYFYLPWSVAVAPDGSFYIADNQNRRVRRVGPDGIVTTVAGNGTVGFFGDGGPATATGLNSPVSVAVAPDGSLYIVDANGIVGGSNRVRRVGLDGIITTVAGNGTNDFTGDGGPATQAGLAYPTGIAFGPDGSFYITEQSLGRVRRVGPDGIITTVAGNGGDVHFPGDGGPATQATMSYPTAVAVAPDGSLYIGEYWGARVRRVGPDGIISTVAGNGGYGFSGDGGPATQASISAANGLAVARDGSLYIAAANSTVRRVGPDGIINTVAGNGTAGFSGDGGPAPQALFSNPQGVAVAPDGSLYIADRSNNRIRRVSPPLPGFTHADIAIASEDGSALYQFDTAGRHLRTLNALTGATLIEFTYDADGQMLKATDGDGSVTTIERDATGNPTAIVGPFGQRTILALDANGYLARITNPSGEAVQISYSADGLLQSFTDPNGHASVMTYDDLGRLLKDQNAAGGSQSLSHTEFGQDYEVTRTTGLNRSTRHRVESLSDDGLRRLVTEPDGTQMKTVSGTDGSTLSTLADGTVDTLLETGDPRFAMQSPIPKTSTITTGGLTSTVATERSVNLAIPGNPLSITNLTDKITVNGRVSTLAYDAASKTFTGTSAAGRIGSSVIDVLGRPTRTQIAGLMPVDSSYDSKGRLASITQGSGVDARTLDFAYNAQGYLDTATDPLGRTVRYAYDAVGRVTRETLPDGREILYSYDANGNLKSLAPPGRPAHAFDYTAVDLPSQYTPPGVAGTGNTLYAYDLDKDPTSLTRPDGLALDYSYDSAGRLSKLSVPTGTVTPEDYSYAYNATTGKLTQITAPDGGKLNYVYSGALPTQTQWTGTVAGIVNWTYDNDFRVTEIKLNGADPIGFQYDADSLLKQAGALTLNRNAQNGLLTGSVLGKVADILSYNGFGEVTGYTASVDATAVFATQYGHDKLGRITQKQETLGPSNHTYDYGYDLAGRLVEVKKDGITTASYTYDDNGNRLTGPGLAVPATYDDQDRLTQYGGAVYTYTANGELETKTVGAALTQYHYDPLGNLRTVTLPGGTAIEYLIDGQGRRIGKKVNGTLIQGFLYQDGLKPIAELDGNGDVVSRFVYATHVNVPDYMIRGGNTYRIITDHLGSPRLVVDTADGSVVQRRDYDEFGRVLAGSFTAPGFQQPFGFAGGLYDADTGLVRFGARDYDAETGRWTAKDPIGLAGGVNAYGYVGQQPISSIDFIGLDPIVLSGHGQWGGGYTVVPEGATITFYAPHGFSITDRLGNEIEKRGEVAASTGFAEVYHSGAHVPNYILSPPVGLNVTKTTGVQTVKTDTKLSELLKPNCSYKWAACRNESYMCEERMNEGYITIPRGVATYMSAGIRIPRTYDVEGLLTSNRPFQF